MIVTLRQNAHWKRLDDLNYNLRKKNFWTKMKVERRLNIHVGHLGIKKEKKGIS